MGTAKEANTSALRDWNPCSETKWSRAMFCGEEGGRKVVMHLAISIAGYGHG